MGNNFYWATIDKEDEIDYFMNLFLVMFKYYHQVTILVFEFQEIIVYFVISLQKISSV